MTPAALVDLRTTLGGVVRRFDVVEVDGPDAETYLEGQLSQQLAGLAVGAALPSLLLQPTGKLTSWLRVLRTAADRFVLVVDAGSGDEVLSRLTRFKLRTAADLTLTTRAGCAIRGPGAAEVPAPAGAFAIPAGWPGVDGTDLVAGVVDSELEVPDGVTVVDDATLDALRIECGVPAMGAELTEATIPAEAGQWLIDASVSFTKGCYTGQELVARIDSRGGNVPRPLRGLLIEGSDLDPRPPVGAAVSTSDGDVGVLTSVAWSPTLGLVGLAPLARSVDVGTAVTVRHGQIEATATVMGLPLR